MDTHPNFFGKLKKKHSYHPLRVENYFFDVPVTYPIYQIIEKHHFNLFGGTKDVMSFVPPNKLILPY